MPVDKELFRTELRRSVQVDRIDSLVGADRQNTFDSAINRRIDDIFSYNI